jgi:cell wall-associated NlpC family hydrolase
MHTARVVAPFGQRRNDEGFRMIRRATLVLGLITTALLTTGLLTSTASATAAASSTPVGSLAPVQQDVFNHRLTVIGWAYVPAKASTSIDVRVYVDGHYAGHLRADRPSVGLNRARHITGQHDFRFVTTWTARATSVTIRSYGLNPAGAKTVLDTSSVHHYMPSPGQRIITVAKRYVGTTRYVEGGSTPSSGFDCSGYTKYVYAQARVRTLPHSAEGQRRMSDMRRITRSQARPGDLVFYLSGGSAYHVAIYAGNGRQYAAATPRDGIRYQAVWSSNVQYRTDWH